MDYIIKFPNGMTIESENLLNEKIKEFMILIKYKGVDITNEISKIEKALNLKLSKDYINIVSSSTYFSVNGYEFHTINNSNSKIVSDTLFYREKDKNFPKNAYIICSLYIGSVYIIQDINGKVYTYQYGNKKVKFEADSFKHFIQKLKLESKTNNVRYVNKKQFKPITDSDIEKFETFLNYKMDKDLKYFIKKYNNATIDIDVVSNNGLGLYYIDNIDDFIKNSDEKYSSYNYTEWVNSKEMLYKNYNVYKNRLIHIGSHGDGDGIVYDKVTKNILYLDHETGDLTTISDSIRDFECSMVKVKYYT